MPEASAPAAPRLAAALDAAAVTLAGAGVRDPRRESTAMWEVCADLPPGEAWLRRDQPASPECLDRFWGAVRTRAAGEPFAYAVGRVAFRTLSLAVDRRALIPRPETEGLVEHVLHWQRGTAAGGLAADIGTGSGCIALSLAREGKFDRVIAVDQSVDAAALARENVARVRPTIPVDVRIGNLLAPLAGERCRAIVANPPYLTEAEWAELDPAVREFEPRMALASGPDGLAATRALLEVGSQVLEPGGLLALEIDERRAEAVQALARSTGWRRVDIHQDLFGRPRYALARSLEDV